MTTGETAMENFPAFPEWFDTNWFHEPPTLRLTVTRMDIDMLAVQTARTMIRIPISDHLESTLGTDKILGALLKTLSGKRFVHASSIPGRAPCPYPISGLR